MIEQHLGFWLWKRPGKAVTFSNFPVLIGFNAMGGYAAPAFVTLAGMGTALFIYRHSNIDRILFFRGSILISFGYLLNFLVPSWFSPGSWYVLHMIGFAIALSPVLRKLPDPILLIILCAVIISTPAIQNVLDTPFYLDNFYMGDYGRPGGILRLAAAEGQFPVFPWLSFFIAGILTGRWLVTEKTKKIMLSASLLIFLGILLSVIYLSGFAFTRTAMLQRAFRIYLGFYPANPPIILMLMGLVLFTIIIITQIEQRLTFSSSNPIVCLGRTSLTLLFLHVIIFRELGQYIHLWKAFSTEITLLIIFGVIIVTAQLTVLWRKTDFFLSMEWILRKIAG